MAAREFSSKPHPANTRFACRIEYDGSAFNGWQSQSQSGALTVQDTLEAALARVAAAPVRVQCAGRTDSGVHAHSQIVHFDAPVSRSCKAWVMGANTTLRKDIRIHWAVAVDPMFHARFSAMYRCYRYLIADTPIAPALLRNQVTWHRKPLDEQRMHEAAQVLRGELDFSAFRASSCQSSSPMRCVRSITVVRQRDMVAIEITANAFLHHMVRNIAGALLAVGDGRKPAQWVDELLRARDRARGADTAPASGLYLVDVAYPEKFGLPATPFGPSLLAIQRTPS
ncbi:MAG: tRNA pseudouridine(38-40) synthase TruA [Halioglobus sp.]|nr:tRNA pseudouridine(38-40) synthase TruA [Halioglobus sp.]